MPLNGPVVEAIATVVDGDPAFDLLPKDRTSTPWTQRLSSHAGKQASAAAHQVGVACGQRRRARCSRRRAGAAPGAAALDHPGQCAADARHEAMLLVTDAGGDSAASRVIPVGLGLGLAGADKRRKLARINEINGGLFVDQGRRQRLDCGVGSTTASHDCAARMS